MGIVYYWLDWIRFLFLSVLDVVGFVFGYLGRVLDCFDYVVRTERFDLVVFCFGFGEVFENFG